MTDDAILDAILLRERGYVDDPVDRGGCTNRGITRATLSAWRGRPVTCDEVKALTEYETREIYRDRYLAPFASVSVEVKPQVVDIAVNSGVMRAKALLALAEQSLKPIQTALVIERLKFYAQIVAGDPSQAKFFKGWINRAVEFL